MVAGMDFNCFAASASTPPSPRRVLAHHADLVAHSGREAVQVKDDRQVIEERYRRTIELLGKRE